MNTLTTSKGLHCQPLLELTVGQLLAQTADRFPDRPAVEYMGKIVTYRELDILTDDIARGLMERGVEKGNHVAIWANDRPNTLYCLYALLKLGAVAVMLGTSLKEYEISKMLEETDVEFVIIDEGYKNTSFLELIKQIRPPRLRELIYIGEKPEPGLFSMDNLLYSAHFAPPEMLAIEKLKVKPSDSDVILFTSGTVGTAKGVVTTHYSRVNSTLAHVRALRATEFDKFCIAIPMFHCFALTAGILTALAAGACVYFPANRRTDSIIKAISEDKCTVFSAVPTLYSALISRTDIDSFDFSSLRTGFIGGSVYSPEFFIKVTNTLKFNLLPSLGQTEATAGYTFTDYDAPLEVKAFTVGTFTEHIEGCIRDINTTEVLETGKTGEICIRGFNVMRGYYRNPELTATVLSPDGWLSTGDLGFMDSDGNIHTTGRLKEMIIRGGENIAPGEIEDIIASDPRVDAVKVVGVPDLHYGEELCACIVLSGDSVMSQAEVRDIVAERLANYKIPKYVLFFNELPRTVSGKIDIGKLQEQAASMLS